MIQLSTKENIKKNSRIVLGKLIYPAVSRLFKLPEIKSIDETIETIISTHCSVSRYGDGELNIILGGSAVFQVPDKTLSKRLADILKISEPGHLVCVADYSEAGMKSLKGSVRERWKTRLAFNLAKWSKILAYRQVYYNAYMSRPYRDMNDAVLAEKRLLRLMAVWKNRAVILVEGESSRIGVGTDLFSGAKSLQRILCPTKNAFSVYDQILAEVCKTDKSKLILIALGPTATVLAYDAFKCGYQAIDIGHVGAEYFAFLRNEKKKDFKKSHNAENVFEMFDDTYPQQVMVNVAHQASVK